MDLQTSSLSFCMVIRYFMYSKSDLSYYFHHGFRLLVGCGQKFWMFKLLSLVI